MFPNDKIIEIFSLCDDFSKNFDDIIQKNSIDARESIHQKNRPFDVKPTITYIYPIHITQEIGHSL